MKGKVIDKKHIVENFTHLVVKMKEEYNFEAGQFALLTFHIEDNVVTRAYSIASPPSLGKKGILEFGIKRKEGGYVSEYVYNKLSVGEEIEISDSKGNMTTKNAPTKDFVFIAAGSGIVPFRSIILDLIENKAYNSITLIHGNKYVKEVPYLNEFSELDKDNKIKYYCVISRETPPRGFYKGHVQDVLFDISKNLVSSKYTYFLCGMPKMVIDVKDKLLNKGIQKENILYEAY